MITVIGTVFVDIKGYPSGKYNPGGRNPGRIETVHGGVGRNIAADMAASGRKCIFVSLTDESGTGENVVKELDTAGVDISFMRKNRNGTGIWMAIFGDDNDVVDSVSQRPDMTPVLDILRESGDRIFSVSDAVTVEIDMDREIMKEVFRLANKYHCPVYGCVSNISLAVQNADFLPGLECLVCNLEEFGTLFSDDFRNTDSGDIADTISDLAESAGIRRMVVTMGADGAVYSDLSGKRSCCGRVPARPAEVVDTTGAGDAFFSGVVMSLSDGKDLRTACEYGAGLSAQVIGIKRSSLA